MAEAPGKLTAPPNTSVVLHGLHKGLRLWAKLGRHQPGDGGRRRKSLPGELRAPEETSFSIPLNALEHLKRQSKERAIPLCRASFCTNQKVAPLQATYHGGDGTAGRGPWLGGQGGSSEGCLSTELSDSPLVVQERGSVGSCQSFPLQCEPVLESVLCSGRGLERSKRGH